MSTAEKARTLLTMSLHSRLMMACSLCSIGNREICDGQIKQAMATLDKLGKILREAEFLLSSPHGLSLTELREGEELVAELKDNIGEVRDGIERALTGLPAKTIH